VAAYYLDISSLPEDTARTYNMEKTIKLLDGTVFPAWDKSKPDDPDWWVDVLFNLRHKGRITEENGWKKAPAAGGEAAKKVESWVLLEDTENKRFINKDPDAFENDIAKAETSVLTGGGIEIVMIAVRKAVSAAGLDSASFAAETSETIGINDPDSWFNYYWDVGAGNNSAKYLTLKLSMQNSSITAAFYSSDAAATVDPGGWRAKFPDKFTDGAVEQTDSTYKSANINVSINKRRWADARRRIR